MDGDVRLVLFSLLGVLISPLIVIGIYAGCDLARKWLQRLAARLQPPES